MCDKKNSVLFTETECLVLSPDFKLLDESQVLLKVPKQNNMYSFDLKNVVPSGGLTCLLSKATIEESNLWHKRLGQIKFKTMNKLVKGNLVRGLPSKLFENDYTCVACQKVLATKDETSGILKTFITGIENQINHKVKIIRYDNGTEFKNNDMNQFCGMKGIKREFSVARTPQQNRVVERKNKTLIEAARTILADSLLPTTFWAEAISTACYVQNRVLVTKPQNKTPYELLHGSGPDWLFDIDLLTNSMNYEPVIAGNQTNKNAGIKDNVDAVPSQQYILLPLLYDSPQSSKDVVTDNAEDNQNVQDFRVTLDNLLVPQKKGYANSTNKDSTVSPSGSTAGQSFTNADDLPTDPIMPDLEDTADLLNTGIFSGAYDDEDVGLEAGLNNLETIMNVSPIPTTKIHKDHPKDQIIGDINLATQTRRMTMISKEHAMKVIQALIDPSWIKAMQDELLHFRLQKVWRLVDLPKGKHAIGTKCVYRNKKHKRGIVIRNKARLVAQENGFRRGTIDKTLFIKKDKGNNLLVQVYVDDVIFGSIKNSLCVEFEQMMHKKFQMSYMGELTFSWGCKSCRKMMESSSAKTSMWLIYGRSLILSFCTRFQVTPKVSHLHAMKRIFRYLKGRPKLGLWYPRDLPFDLEAFSDSDHAGASLDRKSTIGDAKTMFEDASKQSNDPPHLRVNTLGSGEDNMKLKELMELCTKLSKRILDNKNR
ncbi:putative ribonuclease H-like domain-containing protein [Tanacetum coccineum]